MTAANVPPAYAGGLGEPGLAELKQFVDAGGTLVLLDHAAEIGTTVLGVPARVITVQGRVEDDEIAEGPSRSARRQEPLYAPGSILRTLVSGARETAGMADTAAVYFTNSTTFDVTAGSSGQVLLKYPDRGEDILLSGYLSGAQMIAGKVAAMTA